jgi:hypothetical protein
MKTLSADDDKSSGSVISGSGSVADAVARHSRDKAL